MNSKQLRFHSVRPNVYITRFLISCQQLQCPHEFHQACFSALLLSSIVEAACKVKTFRMKFGKYKEKRPLHAALNIFYLVYITKFPLYLWTLQKENIIILSQYNYDWSWIVERMGKKPIFWFEHFSGIKMHRIIQLNRLSGRKRDMASNPLFIIPDFFCIFSMNYLRSGGNGKIPLGR